jgi:sugar O-acyltransferase (sialic acid O-acetyltransferase NeuD family)
MTTRVALVSNDPEIADLLARMDTFMPVGLFDRDYKTTCEGLPVLGDDDAWDKVRASQSDLKLAMAVDPTGLKANLAAKYGEAHFVTVIAPDAFVAKSAQVGAGCVVQSDARLMPKVRLGRFVKVNIGAAVHHDCVVGDFCTLAPGSRLLGNVALEDQVYVGAGAVVLNRIRVGNCGRHTGPYPEQALRTSWN